MACPAVFAVEGQPNFLFAPQLGTLWTARESAPAAVRQPGVALITVVTITAVVVPIARFVAPYATCLPITGSWAPDLEASRFIAENGLKGRMLTWFDWGEYVIWQFGPALKVSMDGRRETVYSDATIRAHQEFYRGGPATVLYSQQLNPDFIWLPASLPVAAEIQSAGWSPLFNGTTSKIWARSSIRSSVPAAALPQPRCFPGP